MLQVSELFIYPIKSLGGIAVCSSSVTDRGFQYDRRWMLVDSNNRFMSQRTTAEMALLQVQLKSTGLKVTHKQQHDSISIPFETKGQPVTVQVWDDEVEAEVADNKLNEWFSDMLGIACRLVHMPSESRRLVDAHYAREKEITSFSDAYPFLVIGQSSLDDLNSRLEKKLPINRFRPNIVFTGGAPYEEDMLAKFSINDIHFYGVKLCARCAVTTIDQDTTEMGKEPLRSLSKYRRKDNKIYFGQNLLHRGEGIISIGDEIKPVVRKVGVF